MILRFKLSVAIFLALAAVLSLSRPAFAQFGYGVNSGGTLFRFDLDTPNDPVFSIGNLGFVPEGIDFRPSTNQLYAIDIGPNVGQLFTVSTATGAATPVGNPFTASGNVGGINYNLTTSRTFGFDFNPKTLQGDGSIRIRLVSNTGVNLRLNSDTGQITNVDTSLAYVAGDPNVGTAPGVDAVAYINSNVASPAAGGTTILFDMDSITDDLATQNPPNNGVLNTQGSFGVTVDAQESIHFDILTDPSDVDPTIGGDSGYAVFRRLELPAGNLGPWVLYDVNLANGQVTNGALVGINGGNPAADFTGGFAALVPEPGSIGLAVLGASSLVALAIRRRRKV